LRTGTILTRRIIDKLSDKFPAPRKGGNYLQPRVSESNRGKGKTVRIQSGKWERFDMHQRRKIRTEMEEFNSSPQGSRKRKQRGKWKTAIKEDVLREGKS
jgi:hypothetical protein